MPCAPHAIFRTVLQHSKQPPGRTQFTKQKRTSVTCQLSPFVGVSKTWIKMRFSMPIRFSRMRSKGSRFTLGVWGLRVCSLDVAFTIATVRNRLDNPTLPMGHLYQQTKMFHLQRHRMHKRFRLHLI
jgi:hypothetical protein